jgi:hypothetical protein
MKAKAPTGILNYFWIQAAASFLQQPPHGGFRSKTAITWPFFVMSGASIPSWGAGGWEG